MSVVVIRTETASIAILCFKLLLLLRTKLLVPLVLEHRPLVSPKVL